MSENPHRTNIDVYGFVEHLITACKKCGESDLSAKLDDAVRGGATGGEILDAICFYFVNNYSTIEKVLGPPGLRTAEEIVAFRNR